MANSARITDRLLVDQHRGRMKSHRCRVAMETQHNTMDTTTHTVIKKAMEAMAQILVMGLALVLVEQRGRHPRVEAHLQWDDRRQEELLEVADYLLNEVLVLLLVNQCLTVAVAESLTAPALMPVRCALWCIRDMLLTFMLRWPQTPGTRSRLRSVS